MALETFMLHLRFLMASAEMLIYKEYHIFIRKFDKFLS